MKLVFRLFAEDVGLLQEKLFTKLVDSSLGYPERFPSRARELFSAMAESGEINWQQVQPRTWLAGAHARLDSAVFAAYGWPPEITDEEILKNLLALNLERAKEYAE